MFTAALRRSGGSLIVTIPQAYVEQNHLDAGSRVALEILGDELKLKPARLRPSLAQLLAATHEVVERVPGWDEMPAAGNEL
ncbi:MAG: AbrB/MazE/SpoVT family DNA-binding domain-containing protein [Gallionellaceae bacterium]